jgi:CRISPR-associated protein Cas2
MKHPITSALPTPHSALGNSALGNSALGNSALPAPHSALGSSALPALHSALPWWYDAFAQVPYEKSPPGAKEMLTIVAYDISDPKRLSRIARVCEDYGIRVQYSIFECHLEEREFDEFWLQLLCEMDEEEDRIVAYKIDARSAQQTQTAGRMVCAEKVVCYLV